MNIGIFGACREGVDCLRSVKASRIFEDDEYFFLDNDERVRGSHLEGICIYSPDEMGVIDLDIIIIAVIDVEKIRVQLHSLGYTGPINNFYGDQYYADKSRKIGMAKIGKYSYYKPSTFLYNVEIGNYCHIGADCRLGLIGHETQNLTTYPLRLKSLSHQFKWEGEAENRLKPLIIEDDVYIGEGVSIMAGIRIGRGSVIGSKSFVTSSVEEYTVVAGAPARKISTRLNKKTQKCLDDSGWVKCDIDNAIMKLEKIQVSDV